MVAFLTKHSPMTKINSRLRLLYRQRRYLSFPLHGSLCNALIQPLFDYACNAWYPSINKKLKTRLKAAQNKCIRFCLNLDDRFRLKSKEFERINWISVQERISQCSSCSIYNFFQNTLWIILKNSFFQQKKLLVKHVFLFKN